jgi:hypothetical protein
MRKRGVLLVLLLKGRFRRFGVFFSLFWGRVLGLLV